MNKKMKWLVAVLAVFAAATAVGAFCSVRTEPMLLYDYFKELSGGEISIRAGTAVLSALAVWLILFFSAFFKFGAVTAAIVVAGRGFVDGYSVAAILRILGLKGLPLCFFDLPGIPFVLLMAANVMCSLTFEDARGAGYLLKSLILLAAMLAAAAIFSLVGTGVLTSVLTKFQF